MPSYDAVKGPRPSERPAPMSGAGERPSLQGQPIRAPEVDAGDLRPVTAAGDNRGGDAKADRPLLAPTDAQR